MSLHVTVNTAEEDLYTMLPLGKLVWNSVFRKPPPVGDIKAWATSAESDEYVYVPNNLAKEGDEAEAFMANAHCTEILTEAYRTMCASQGISPRVATQDGTVFLCDSVKGHYGAQYKVVGEKASRLANSTLIDFDDSAYAVEFIRQIMSLRKDQYESEAVLRRVLAKVEHILMGRSSHTYNQRFIQKFLDLLDQQEDECDGVSRDKILSIFQTMLLNGVVLEDSIEDFTARAVRAGLRDKLPLLKETFGGSCGRKA